MKPKQNDVSTVIIVDKSGGSSKTLQVKTRHISRFKHYLLGVAGLIVALCGTIFYLHKQSIHQELERQKLLAQIEQIKGQIPSDDDKQEQADNASSAQTYIQGIQAKLTKINDYLKKRGLGEFSIKSIGGAKDDRSSPTDQYAAYNEYLTRLVNTVARTPMGYPRLSAVNSIFGYRSDPFENGHAEYHPGIDFAGHRGDAVKATADGKVTFTGWRNGYGNCIIIKHIANFETLYGHLSHINVKEGQKITTGDVIGKVGSTGRSTGPHLHYEVRENGRPVNPKKFLTLNR